jgi:hypothetical protein
MGISFPGQLTVILLKFVQGAARMTLGEVSTAVVEKLGFGSPIGTDAGANF